jgi:hypothetical protein
MATLTTTTITTITTRGAECGRPVEGNKKREDGSEEELGGGECSAG